MGREGRPPVSDLACGRRQTPAVFLVVRGIHGHGVHEPFRQRHAEGSLPFPDEQAFGRRPLAGSLRGAAFIRVRLRKKALPARGVSGRGEGGHHAGHLPRSGTGIVQRKAVRRGHIPLRCGGALHPALGAAQIADAVGQVGGQSKLLRLQGKVRPCNDDCRTVRQVRECVEHQRLLARRRHVVAGMRVHGAVRQVEDRRCRGQDVDQARGIFL